MGKDTSKADGSSGPKHGGKGDSTKDNKADGKSSGGKSK